MVSGERVQPSLLVASWFSQTTIEPSDGCTDTASVLWSPLISLKDLSRLHGRSHKTIKDLHESHVLGMLSVEIDWILGNSREFPISLSPSFRISHARGPLIKQSCRRAEDMHEQVHD